MAKANLLRFGFQIDEQNGDGMNMNECGEFKLVMFHL